MAYNRICARTAGALNPHQVQQDTGVQAFMELSRPWEEGMLQPDSIRWAEEVKGFHMMCVSAVATRSRPAATCALL